MLDMAVLYCKAKAGMLFNRIFKEQKGGSELVATLIIVGIVLVLAFAFKDKLIGMTADLWNNLVHGSNPNASQDQIIGTW